MSHEPQRQPSPPGAPGDHRDVDRVRVGESAAADDGRERTAAVLAALGAAVASVAGDASLDRVLHQLAVSARELAGARYAAIGVPEPEGDRFAKFVTVGMSDELIERIGPLPRTHGLLAAMLSDPSPYRTPDITADPRFQWWPPAHPRMRSFLGVPIVSRGDVIGAFYLTDKEDDEKRSDGPPDEHDDSERRSSPRGRVAHGASYDWPTFSDADEASVVLLAAHAAIAIEQARLFEDSRELALAGERARLARELHDAMSQSLFSLRLAAETASSLLQRDPPRATDELATVRDLAGRISGELRSVVEGLRPADLERDGLVATLRSQLTIAGRAHAVEVELDAPASPDLEPDAEHQVLRVVQEAVTNALRHAKADRVTVVLTDDDDETLVVRVVDDGIGFDPSAPLHRSRRLGLTSMQERTAALGGTLAIRSEPGSGTTVELRIPR